MKLTWEQFENSYFEAYTENNMFVGAIEKRETPNADVNLYITLPAHGMSRAFKTWASAKAYICDSFLLAYKG